MVRTTLPSPPRHNSRILPGPSGCHGLRVSRYYNCGPLLSHHIHRIALSFALPDPILGLYTDNASAPLNAQAGLRRVYKFGLYSHCAYVDETAGLCTKANGLYIFQPYKAITSDMPSNYSDHTNAIIHNTTFANSILLGGSSHLARRFLLSGATVALMALIRSVRLQSPFFGPDSLTVRYTIQRNCRVHPQAPLDALVLRPNRRRRRHIHSCRFSHLDSPNQDGGEHQSMDNHLHPRPARHTCVRWRWVILFLGSVRSSAGEHHSLPDQVRAILLSDSYDSGALTHHSLIVR